MRKKKKKVGMGFKQVAHFVMWPTFFNSLLGAGTDSVPAWPAARAAPLLCFATAADEPGERAGRILSGAAAGDVGRTLVTPPPSLYAHQPPTPWTGNYNTTLLAQAYSSLIAASQECNTNAINFDMVR